MAGLKLEEVRARLESTSPEKVAAAGRAYNAAAGKLAAARQEIADAIDHLSERWRGPAANEALATLNKLKESAEELAAKSGQTGRALQQYGEKILPWYKSHLPGDGFVRSGRDDEYAQKFMGKLNTRIAQTYVAVPGEIRVELPGIGQRGESARTDLSNSSGSRLGGPPPGQLGGVPLSSPAGSDVSASSAASDGAPRGHEGGGSPPSQTGIRGEPGTDLASVPPPGVGTSPGPGPSTPATPTGPTGSGMGGAAPLLPGAGPRLPAPAAGSRGLSQGGPSAAGRSPRFGPVGPGASGPGILGGPGASAGSPEEEERERSTWLAEDRDIWGADPAESVPSVIGEQVPFRRVEERQVQVETVAPHADTGSDNPEPHGDVAQHDDLDLLIDELEAELDLEIIDLAEEGHGADGEEQPALDDDFDDLLDELLDDDDPGRGGGARPAS
ncbi:WXG100 family type VII secretion target [Spirillospora sp. CA-255316]